MSVDHRAERSTWFIHGERVRGGSGESFETLNPATNEPIARIDVAEPEDVERAIVSAEAGFAAWSSLPGRERGRILYEAQRLVRAHRAELAELESLDGGKPIAERPEADIDSGADCIEFFAGLAGALNGE